MDVKIARISSLIAFVLMLAVNYLANALPLNNLTTGQVSDLYPSLFTPASITFSIWAVIYLMLLVVCIFQFVKNTRKLDALVLWAFIVSCLLNASWVFAWHYKQLLLSMVIILSFLGVLIVINFKLAGETFGPAKAAFGVYLGWICVAVIANAAALLVGLNWGRLGVTEVTWTILMVFAATIISVLSIFRFKNPFIGISVIWGFAGIALKRRDDFHSIAIAAVCGMLIVTLASVYGFLKKPRDGSSNAVNKVRT